MKIEVPMTDEEHARVVIAGVMTGPKTEGDLVKMVNWAREARTFAVILQCVLDGTILLEIVDGEVAFRSASVDETKEVRQRFLQLSACTDEKGNLKGANQ